MEVIHCPNCGKLSGFKRALGFGTFFMVLFSAGFWLLLIPFYPVRCIGCGLRRSAAAPQSYRGILSGIVLALLGMFVVIASQPGSHKPAVIVDGPAYLSSMQAKTKL